DATPWEVGAGLWAQVSGYAPPPLADPGQPTPADARTAPAKPAADQAEPDELVYELVSWLPEQRAWLSVLLQREGIPHEWEREDLVVPTAFEARAEELFDQVEGKPSPSGPLELEAQEGGAEDEAVYK